MRYKAFCLSCVARELQACDSLEERATIIAKRNRRVLEIVYGESAIDHGIRRQTDAAPEHAVVAGAFVNIEPPNVDHP